MEAVLLNASAVFLKWKAPELKEQHGKYHKQPHPLSFLPPSLSLYLSLTH